MKHTHTHMHVGSTSHKNG